MKAGFFMLTNHQIRGGTLQDFQVHSTFSEHLY